MEESVQFTFTPPCHHTVRCIPHQYLYPNPIILKIKAAIPLWLCTNLYTSYVQEGVDKPLWWNSNLLYVIITHPHHEGEARLKIL